MKSLLILLLGCLPLAILTAESFVELRSIDGGPYARAAAVDPPLDAVAARNSQSQATAEKPLAEGLGQVDLWVSETLPGLKNLTAGSSFAPLKDSWTGWTNVRQLVGRSAGVRAASATAGAEQLQELARSLEQLKADYEKTRPEGSQAVLTLLGRRIEAIHGSLARAAGEREAESLLAQVRAEFQPERFGRSATLCDEWLAKYSSLDAAATAKVRVLRDRARFLDAYERMRAEVRAADSPAGQKVIVASFLAKHADRPSPSDREREVLQQCQLALSRLDARLQAETLSRQAAESLRELAARPPSGLAERLRAAAGIARQYPAASVGQTLREQVRSWLAETFADKQIEEPAGLLEAESRQGQILRGFFRKSSAPDGSLLGYQFFTSQEQYRDPRAQVGTYGKEDLVAAPGPSLPRQCAGQYRAAREAMLAQPGRKPSWEDLAAACEQLDKRLLEYRRKPGASPGPLSFQAEGRQAREILSAPVWDQVESLFGK